MHPSSQDSGEKIGVVFSLTHVGIQMDKQFGHEGLHGCCQAQLLGRLLGWITQLHSACLADFSRRVQGRCIPAHFQAHDTRCAMQLQRSVVQWVAVSGDPQKETGINHSVVARYGPCNTSWGMDAFHADAAQISPVHLCWQQHPRSAQLIWAFLFWGISLLPQAGWWQKLGTPLLLVSCLPGLPLPQPVAENSF